MIRTFISVIVFMLICSNPSFAQFSQEARDSINRLNTADHQLVMQKLGIETLRSGPSGNPNDPNAANNDEFKVSDYGKLPDPLIFKNGEPVTNKIQWQERRKEIIEDFDREVYGRLPEKFPNVNWKIISQKDLLSVNIPLELRNSWGW